MDDQHQNPYQASKVDPFRVGVMELNAETEKHCRNQLMILRVISLGLMMGVLTFGVVIGLQKPGVPDAGQRGGLDPMFMIAAFMVFAAIVASIVIRILPVRAGKTAVVPPGVEERIASIVPRVVSMHIVSMALLEAASFFGLIHFMTSRNTYVLAVPALGIFCMLALFPTWSWLISKIESAK